MTDVYHDIKLPECITGFIRVYKSLPKEIKLTKQLFEQLWNLHPSERGQVKIFGKLMSTPRWQQSYGINYIFSGLEHQALPLLSPILLNLKAYAETQSKTEFHQCLVNWYENGVDNIGFHSDDETQLAHSSDIWSFSFGAERRFIVKSKKTTYKMELPLYNNSALVMGGDMQQYFKHSVPKQLKIKDRRINVTFRKFKAEYINKV